ncbi:lysophospholipase [Robertkochia solimangrovi]|nr:lysophospholipase [Robertkochia solimangrovi]
MKILFQGDSITDGNRSRNDDWNHVMGHGYAYLIASRLWYDFPDKQYMFYNRGISGNTVKDLNDRWQEDTLKLNPDLISILAGVNDIFYDIYDQKTIDYKALMESYSELIEKSRENNPNVKIVLCEPFTLRVGHVEKDPANWESKVGKLQELVRELAATYKAHFVALQKPFNDHLKLAPAKYWIWDGIHPMPAGHELIAREWLKQTQGLY